MDSRIKRIVEELSVTIYYDSELKKKAHYVAKYNLIVVNGNLSDGDIQKSVLHELGHAAKHRNNTKMYNLIFSLHSKMENEAEEFMIEKMIETRLSNPDFSADGFNCINFLESYNLDLKYEYFIKSFMTNYFSHDLLDLSKVF